MTTRLPPESEKEFQAKVIRLAHLFHWRCAHFCAGRAPSGRWITPGTRDSTGFPDLILVRERLLVVELKTDAGRLTAEQQAWLEALQGAGVDARVWRPSMWKEIERVLR